MSPTWSNSRRYNSEKCCVIVLSKISKIFVSLIPRHHRLFYMHVWCNIRTIPPGGPQNEIKPKSQFYHILWSLRCNSSSTPHMYIKYSPIMPEFLFSHNIFNVGGNHSETTYLASVPWYFPKYISQLQMYASHVWDTRHKWGYC